MPNRALQNFLYPELRAFDPPERAQALRAARRTPFDVLELLAMAAGLVLAAAGLARSASLAIAVGAACVVPFLVRRVRRGLRQVGGRRP